MYLLVPSPGGHSPTVMRSAKARSCAPRKVWAQMDAQIPDEAQERMQGFGAE